MSDGPPNDEELERIFLENRVRNMAESLERVKNLLKKRSEKTVENAKRKKDPKRARAALHAAQDFYYLMEVFELIQKVEAENSMLRETVDFLGERLQAEYEALPSDSPKKREMN